jgi:steroid delta-isomerase
MTEMKSGLERCLSADHETDVDRISHFFENLAPADLDRLAIAYTGDAYFKDPFNEVRGIKAIRDVYLHMFETLAEPHFVVVNKMEHGHACWLAWEFRFCFKSYRKGEQQVIRGASHLLLNESGLISSHRDYWDAAEELYEKLPVAGSLMRWLKRKMRANKRTH